MMYCHTGSPVSQIQEQILEWKSAIKCSLFSFVHWQSAIRKRILKSDLDFLTLDFSVVQFYLSVHNVLGTIVIDVKAVATQYI